jgi:hypothetical protein
MHIQQHVVSAVAVSSLLRSSALPNKHGGHGGFWLAQSLRHCIVRMCQALSALTLTVAQLLEGSNDELEDAASSWLNITSSASRLQLDCHGMLFL